MPSGKRLKQQRSAPAPPPPTRRGPRQASPRALAIGGGVAALIVIAIVLGVVLSGGSSSASSWGTTALPQAQWITGGIETQALLGGIPQNGLTLGSASAPVTLVEYIDLQCPYCHDFEIYVFPDFVKQYVRTGKVKVVMRPLAFIGPDSVTGRKALVAASFQNKAFNFAALLYDNQRTENTGWLNADMMKFVAQSIPGLDPGKVDTERTLSSVEQVANASDASATAAHVASTPTLYAGTSLASLQQVQITSATDKATLFSTIDALLK